MRRVLEGKAVVKVVDVEAELLEKGMKGLSIGEKEESGSGGQGPGLVGGWRKYAGAVGGSERK